MPAHRHFNGLKTALLLGGLSAALIVVGSFFGRGGLIIALVLALGMNLYSYWNSDKLAIRAMHAYPVTERAGARNVPDRPRALHACQSADAAGSCLADAGSQRVRHRARPEERRRPGAPRGSCGSSTNASCAPSSATS